MEMSAEQAICNMQVDKLAEQLNEEVSTLTLMDANAAQNYDWRIVGMVQ